MPIENKKFNRSEPHRNAPRRVWCKNKCMFKLNNCYKVHASVIKKKAWKRNLIKRTLDLLKKVEYYHEFLRDRPDAIILDDYGETDLELSIANVNKIINDLRELYTEQGIPIPTNFPEALKRIDRGDNSPQSIRKALLSW